VHSINKVTVPGISLDASTGQCTVSNQMQPMRWVTGDKRDKRDNRDI
jgi:hypothetical protein